MPFHCGRYFCRRRQLFILTILIALVFLMYQLFSVGQLGKELSKRKPKSRLHTNFKSYEKADGFMRGKYDDEKDSNGLSHFKNFNLNQEILGVLPVNKKFYTPSDKNTFKCIHSGEEINFSMVNDNFCDCMDFSDEPSTPACNFGRFYCSHQSKKGPNDIISYKVNDGICDCCDGSDEWQHVLLPTHTILSATSQQKGIFQAPCLFRC